MRPPRVPASSFWSPCTRASWRARLPPSAARIRAQLYASQRPDGSKFAKKQSFKEYWAEQWRLAKKDYPILLSVGIIGATGSMLLLALVLWDDYTRVSPQFAGYPAKVETKLRQALFAIHVQPDPERAEYLFLQALHAADAEGMDPYSPEVMGIRIRLAEMQEKFGRAKAAVEVLDGIINLCKDKVAAIDRSAAPEEPEQARSLRQFLLGTNIRSRVKIAALYDGDYLQDRESAKRVLSDAVALLVNETEHPQTHALTEDNPAGLPLDEIASMMSHMGDLYATTGEEANAVQTYMLALQPLRAACGGARSCKEVQLFSNIASTMDLAMKKPGAIINGKPATKESLAAARRAVVKWADQAIATAESVKPEHRDEICELGLISAEMTKADLLLEDGKTIQAREAFRSIIPTLREKGLDALVQTAEAAIERAGG